MVGFFWFGTPLIQEDLPDFLGTRVFMLRQLLIGLLIVTFLLMRPQGLLREERRVSRFVEGVGGGVGAEPGAAAVGAVAAGRGGGGVGGLEAHFPFVPPSTSLRTGFDSLRSLRTNGFPLATSFIRSARPAAWYGPLTSITACSRAPAVPPWGRGGWVAAREGALG